MNKSIIRVVLLGSLGISVIAAGCSQPAPAAMKSQPALITPAATVAQATIASIFGSVPATDELMVDELEMAIQGAIAELIMSGQPVADHEYAALRSVEDARGALASLEIQRCGTQSIIDAYTLTGQSAPGFEYATLQAIEDARLTVLAGVGLVY